MKENAFQGPDSGSRHDVTHTRACLPLTTPLPPHFPGLQNEVEAPYSQWFALSPSLPCTAPQFSFHKAWPLEIQIHDSRRTQRLRARARGWGGGASLLPPPPAAPPLLERPGHAVTLGCLYLVSPQPAMLHPLESSGLVPSCPSGLSSCVLLSTRSSRTRLVSLEVTPSTPPLSGCVFSLCASAV